MEVTVGGRVDPDTGYLIDLGKLQEIIDQVIIEPCDHKNLNLDVDFLQGVITSTENLAEIFFHRLKVPVESAAADGSNLVSVKLFETERNSAEYRI
jgi:6-pyruvoyltetrahydropterin/6-carboxytetrahydropterin synthase